MSVALPIPNHRSSSGTRPDFGSEYVTATSGPKNPSAARDIAIATPRRTPTTPASASPETVRKIETERLSGISPPRRRSHRAARTEVTVGRNDGSTSLLRVAASQTSSKSSTGASRPALRAIGLQHLVAHGQPHAVSQLGVCAREHDLLAAPSRPEVHGELPHD